jgi:putative flippase GtrA
MKNSLLKKIPDYYIVSLFSVIINLAIYWLLVHFGVNYIVAATVGFIFETVIAYFLNRFWTFSNTTLNIETGYIRSLLVAVFNLLLILVFTISGVEILRLNYFIARIIAGIIVGIISFVFDAKFSFAVWPKMRK